MYIHILHTYITYIYIYTYIHPYIIYIYIYIYYIIDDCSCVFAPFSVASPHERFDPVLQRSRKRRFKASLPTWYLFFKRSFKQPKRGFNQQKSGRYRGYQNWQPMGTVNLKVDWTNKILSFKMPDTKHFSRYSQNG